MHPTFSVVGYHQEVLSIHYKGLPVPGTVGGDPLVEGELQLSGAPLVDDRELLTPFIWPKVSHGQEDLEEKRYLVSAPDQEPSLQDSGPQHLSHTHREGRVRDRPNKYQSAGNRTCQALCCMVAWLFQGQKAWVSVTFDVCALTICK